MKTKMLLALLPIVCFASCTKPDKFKIDNSGNKSPKVVLSYEEFISIAFDNIAEVPESKLFSLIADFIEMEAGGSETRSFTNPDFSVKSKQYLGRKSTSEMTRSNGQETEESVPVYEIAVVEGDQASYAFVSADIRAPGVLAFFNDFSIDELDVYEALDNPNARAVLAMTKIQLVKDIERVEKIRTELRDAVIKKVCDELGIPVSKYSFEDVVDRLEVAGSAVSRNHGGVQVVPGKHIEKKEPMCKLVWDQKAPYNRACPDDKAILWTGPSAGYVVDAKVLAGCVPIACMNIEACLERPEIGGIPMDWDYYKTAVSLFEASEGQTGGTPALLLDRAGEAIRYIYDKVKAFSLYKSFNGQRYSYATASSYGPAYIRENFNAGASVPFDPDVVLSSLDKDQPVYMSGQILGDSEDSPGDNGWEGHAYILDGYVIAEKSTVLIAVGNDYLPIAAVPQSRTDQYDKYWHINLGWKWISNAYFKLDSDATCTPEFYDTYGRYNLVHLKDQTIIPYISKK